MYFYCYVCSVLGIVSLRSVYCLCANVYCTAATGCQPNCSCQIYHITSYIISYHIISYHIISYHIISYHIISYHIISYHTISYHIISYHIISYHIISYHIISCHIISYHIISFIFNPWIRTGLQNPYGYGNSQI
jgi:hypothetical protein